MSLFIFIIGKPLYTKSSATVPAQPVFKKQHLLTVSGSESLSNREK
jgi:hypothetical protein